jgi:hypothetical protein
VAEERVSALLDLSYFRKHEVATFMTAFLENLYRLKAREAFRTPLMLEVDEADAIAPQKPQPNEARMLGAMEDVVRRGGQRGLGCILITQRSAVLNKNVLTQAEMIIALRTIAPQDLAAIDAWVEVHGTEEEREKLMSSLPSLPVGDAWVWAPGWPTADGIFERVHISPIETFDSGASPKAGEKRVEPKNLADVDLGALTKQMAATIEKAKADDPKQLRKQLAERDSRIRQLEKTPPAKAGAKAATAVDPRAIERAVRTATTPLRKALEAAMKFIINVSTQNFDVAGVDKAELEKAVLAAVGRATQMVDGRLSARQKSLEQLRESAKRIVGQLKAALDDDSPIEVNVAVQKNEPFTVSTEGLSRPQQRILNTLATFELLGKSSANKSNVAVFSDASPTSSSFQNNLGALRSLGLIDYPTGGSVALTDGGRAVATADASFSTLDELHQAWYAKLSGPQSRILQALIPSHPDAIDKIELAEKAGASATSSSYGNNLGTLRSLGLIDYRSGGVFATDLLFPEGLS